MQALIMSPTGRVFLRLRKDLSRVDERFASGIGTGDLSGTNMRPTLTAHFLPVCVSQSLLLFRRRRNSRAEL